MNMSSFANDLDGFINRVKNAQEEEIRYLPDTKKKTDQCVDFVERGAQLLLNTNLVVACNAFMFNPEWRAGEIFNFLLDDKGDILCHGDNINLIWQNISFVKDFLGHSIFRTIQQIRPEGQWVNYRWNNGYKFAYMKKILLNNNIYYLGAGFFPQTKEHIAQSLVRTAVRFMEETPSKTVFTRVSNPHDVFVLGDVSMYVVNFEGEIVADASDIALVGQNMLSLQDASGNYTIQDIIARMKKKKSAWFTVNWLNNIQENYGERIYVPRDKQSYIFAAGYYATIDEVTAAELLVKAIKHIEQVGSKRAFIDFSSSTGEFSKGRLSLSVYDFTGKNLASSEEPALIGQDLMNKKDIDGKSVVQDIVKIAKTSGEGVVITNNRNSYEKLFVKTTDTPEGKIIVVVGHYVQSKAITAQALIELAVRNLQHQRLESILEAITDPIGSYYLGDVYLFVYNMRGTLLASGEHKRMIWNDNLKVQDEAGKPVVKDILSLGKRGGGWMTYKTRNATRRIYIQPVELVNPVTKTQETFIIGSGYFL